MLLLVSGWSIQYILYICIHIHIFTLENNSQTHEFEAKDTVFLSTTTNLPFWSSRHDFGGACDQYPIASTYGMFTYIYHKNQLNVGVYTIHA